MSLAIPFLIKKNPVFYSNVNQINSVPFVPNTANINRPGILLTDAAQWILELENEQGSNHEPVFMKSQITESKDIDCILIFDPLSNVFLSNKGYRIERLSTTLTFSHDRKRVNKNGVRVTKNSDENSNSPELKQFESNSPQSKRQRRSTPEPNAIALEESDDEYGLGSTLKEFENEIEKMKII